MKIFHVQSLVHPIKNTLLNQLTQAEFSRLAPFLKIVQLQTSALINSPGEVVRWVYFPIDSIISLFKIDKNGNTNQIAMVGNEGMIGISALNSSQESFNATVQKKGIALRISNHRLVNEFNRHGALFNKILEYLQQLIAQIGQVAVCNCLHSIEQQLCRWLLQTLDRSLTDKITMTQEGIGLCLGVRRESICEASSKLHRLGAINYSRGHIEVTNRRMLESLSCECYVQSSSVHPKNNILLM
ncbi:MAG: Crp/Fnr family transcriptional regulator [Kangiellaceae bacterium]|nr:Crp/Fnr family transcriptional regulator [Kangiellaceae bacterium]MCW9017433.1 Crp/Fnr family transcriptional regulator [Kangiellaceae bacterium]